MIVVDPTIKSFNAVNFEEEERHQAAHKPMGSETVGKRRDVVQTPAQLVRLNSTWWVTPQQWMLLSSIEIVLSWTHLSSRSKADFCRPKTFQRGTGDCLIKTGVILVPNQCSNICQIPKHGCVANLLCLLWTWQVILKIWGVRNLDHEYVPCGNHALLNPFELTLCWSNWAFSFSFFVTGDVFG